MGSFVETAIASHIREWKKQTDKDHTQLGQWLTTLHTEQRRTNELLTTIATTLNGQTRTGTGT